MWMCSEVQIRLSVGGRLGKRRPSFYGERERNNWPCLYEIPIDAICGRKSEKNMKKAVEFGKNPIAKPSGICYNIPVIHTLPQLTRWVAVLSGPAFPVFEKRQKGQA